MSKVVFLEVRLFRNNMVETYQFDQIRELGHEVEIWYLGNLFGGGHKNVLNAPAIQKYLVMIDTLAALKDKVRQLEPGSILFSMFGVLHYYPILYKIVKSRKDLIWIGRTTKTNATAGGKRQNPLKAVLGNIMFYKLYRPFSNVVLYLAQKVIRKYGHAIGVKAYQPDYLLVSNNKYAPLHFPKDKVIVTHSDDYNIHLLNKDVSLDPAYHDAIVFLDQMLYYHSDFRKLGEGMMDVDTYYQRLNQVLDDVSRKYGKPVVIAGHPEADKHPRYAEKFQGKKFVVGKSVSLVRHASLVVTHYSTAVNFAAIYNKPLLLLTSSSFETFDKIIEEIKALDKALHPNVLNIDDYNLEDMDLGLIPDYSTYKDNYIKSDNTPEELSYPYVVKHVVGQHRREPAL